MLENQRLQWNLFWLRRCEASSKAYVKHYKAVRRLLAGGAQISPKDAQWLLGQVAIVGTSKFAIFLLKRGATLADGQNLLQAALNALNAAMVYWLLEQQVPFFPGIVHQVAMLGYVKLLKQLKRLGVNMQEKNQDGDTALHRAVLEGHSVKVVKYLATVCKLNAKNNKGMTALYDCGMRAVSCPRQQGPSTLNDQFVEVLLDTPGIQIHNIGPASFSRFYSTHSEWDKKIRKKLRIIDALSLASSDDESYESSDSTVIFTEIVQPGRVILHSQCWDPDDEVAAPLVSLWRVGARKPLNEAGTH